MHVAQAVFSLDVAASGHSSDFDVSVESLTVPAGFNLRGTASIIYTKTLGDDAFLGSSRGPAALSALRRERSATLPGRVRTSVSRGTAPTQHHQQVSAQESSTTSEPRIGLPTLSEEQIVEQAV